MANVLKNEKKQQVLALGRLGWSLRQIEDATGVRRETAGKYLRASGVPVRAPGGWGHRPPPKPAIEVFTDSGAESPKPAIEVFTDSETRPSKPGRSPSASACVPHREFIELSLRRGRNAMAIWQDLVDRHGFEHGYQSVRRFVAKSRAKLPPDARAVIQTPPGRETQVDYGSGPMVRHPDTGKYRRTRLFVLTLGYSRKSVRLLTFRSSSRIWVELHERAFRRLGGSTEVMVLDNLKEGVLKPDIYDPTLNPLYADFLAHHDVAALPCKPRDPDRKGKVESAVGHAKKTPLKGLRFESLQEAQDYLDHWESRWGDTRIHGRLKRQVSALFEEERPDLGPLPVEPFRYYEHGRRTVHLDGHVEVCGAYYSVPPGRISERVLVQWDPRQVRILDIGTGQLLREHLRDQPGRWRTKDEDRPRRIPPKTITLLTRADLAGRHVGAVCKRMHEQDGPPAERRILGILSMAKKHGDNAVDEACATALEVGAPTYRFVRRLLERRPPVQLTLKQVDPLIRDLTAYRDLITTLTEDPLS